jgi:hypothetical protein
VINSSEHFYDDDPGRGHPDVRTRLTGVSYFFVGNGLIQAAVQWAPGGEGSPLGLLVMDPERLRKKREALTMHADRGLGPTSVRVCDGSQEQGPRAGAVGVDWVTHKGVPAVLASWRWGGGQVTERFFCPDPAAARLVREVVVEGSPAGPLTLRTSVPGQEVEAPLQTGGATTSFVYELDPAASHVQLRAVAGPIEPEQALAEAWAARPRFSFGDAWLDRLWQMSTFQLSAMVARSGCLDSSVWQYNREWVRDQALVALGLVVSGDRETGRRILRRLLREFVSAEGGTVDSSEVRQADEAELDQNGVLLHVLRQYVLWTGDLSIAEEQWNRVAAIADYPLRPEFAHPSGLLHNRREYWERHRIHGIEPGFELVHQVFVSLGLAAAASLARQLGRVRDAERWDAAAARLRSAALEDPVYRLVSDGALVKRKRLDGGVQQRVEALPEAALPDGVPLAGPGAHLLEPDTCTVLPIVFGFVDPASPLAARTLDKVDALWNQAWSDGGYGRYHVSSEPDSPGAWPFASLFVARASVEAGRLARARSIVDWLGRAPGAPAGSWFEFHGPRLAPPFPQVGIIPWTWSEIIMLLAGHVLGVRPTADGVRVTPRPLPGQGDMRATLRVRDHAVDVEVPSRNGRADPTAAVRIDGVPT